MNNIRMHFCSSSILVISLIFCIAPSVFALPKPDLAVRIKCPETAVAGQNLGNSITIEINNTTKVTAKTVGVDIVLSKDTVIPLKSAVYQANWTEDVLLKEGREFVDNIKGMSTVTVRLNGSNTIPADTPTGLYYIGVFVDSSNSNDEVNERNNTAVCAINITGTAPSEIAPKEDISKRPDLTIGKIWVTPLKIFVGNKADLHCSFQNVGANLTGTWKIGYLIDGVEISTQNFGDIAAGASENPSSSWAATAPGVHRFGCILDYGNTVNETTKINNKALMEFNVLQKNITPAEKPK